MFPFALSLFDTGLLTVIVSLMLLYLIILIKLKPPTEGEKILRTGSAKRNIREIFSIKRQNSPVVYETREEPAERNKAIEKLKPVSTVSIETEKTVFSGDTQPSGCPHYFGYLREHPKNTPLPNECFTCIKIMECLVGVE